MEPFICRGIVHWLIIDDDKDVLILKDDLNKILFQAFHYTSVSFYCRMCPGNTICWFAIKWRLRKTLTLVFPRTHLRPRSPAESLLGRLLRLVRLRRTQDVWVPATLRWNVIIFQLRFPAHFVSIETNQVTTLDIYIAWPGIDPIDSGVVLRTGYTQNAPYNTAYVHSLGVISVWIIYPLLRNNSINTPCSSFC